MFAAQVDYVNKTFEQIWREHNPGYERYLLPSQEYEQAWDGLIRELLYPLIRSTFDDFEVAVDHYEEWSAVTDSKKKKFHKKWALIYYKRAMKQFARFNYFGPEKLDIDFYVYKQPWFDNVVLDYPYVCWRGQKWNHSFMRLY